MSLEDRFHQEMLRIYEEAKEFGYYPSYLRGMVVERGGLSAAKHLLGRSVLITFWLIVLTVSPVAVSTFIWRDVGLMLSIGAVAVLWFIFGTVIVSAQDEESKSDS